MLKNNGHKPSWGQFVKSHKKCFNNALLMDYGNGNRLSRPYGTQTLILCGFHQMRLLNAWQPMSCDQSFPTGDKPYKSEKISALFNQF